MRFPIAGLNDVFRNDLAAREWLCNEESSIEFALLIVKGYREWLHDKQRTSTDEKFKKLIHFVLIVDDYREFRMALNTGDAVMIECLYRDFLPKFYLTKKKNYVEIILTQMDQFYKKIGSRRLQMVRVNRTVPLYGGYDNQGIPMATCPWMVSLS